MTVPALIVIFPLIVVIPVKDLYKIKTEATMISLSRSLRLLEAEGLVRMKTNCNESFVRLCDKGNLENAYLLDVFQVGG